MDKLAEEWHDAVEAVIDAMWKKDNQSGLDSARTRLLEATRAYGVKCMEEEHNHTAESNGWPPEAPIRKAIATELLPDRPTGEGWWKLTTTAR